MPQVDPVSDPPGAAAISRGEIVLFLAVGVALRIWWLVLVGGWTHPIDLGEATNEALAFARTGTLADAYFVGQGPTAHLMPTAVVIAGSIERLFGIGTPAATATLGLWALAQVSIGFALVTTLFQRLAARRTTLIGGLGLLCLVPAQIVAEAADFRVWEGALAFDLAAANLLWITILQRRGTIGWRDLTLGALLVAAAFFVNPPAGLGAGAAWAGFALLRLSWRETLRFGLLTAAAVALVVGPWLWRNDQAVGAPVLRSNFGVELAIADNDDAVTFPWRRAAEEASFHQTAERLRQAGGEVAYSRAAGARAQRWIAAHPLRFVQLSLRHYRQFFLPDTWEEAATNWQGANRLRIRIIQLTALLGLAGLAVALRRQPRSYLPLALYMGVAGAPYAAVQPIPRYGYLIWPLLVFLAVQLLADLARRARGARDRPAA